MLSGRTVVLVVAALSLGCGRGDVAPARGADAIIVVDGDGDTVRLAAPAKRVVSLVSSATDVVVALGAKPQLAGRTRYDKAPEIADVPSVGGGIDPDLERLIALKPDLVLGWNGTARDAARQAIAARGIPVYGVAVRDSAALFKSIADIGRLLAVDSAARALATQIRGQLKAVQASVASQPTPTVLYVIWGDPPMTVGPHTFISELIHVAGGRNVFDDATTDWPRVSMEEIVHRAPDVVLLSVGEDTARGAEQLLHAPGWRTIPAVRTGHVASIPANLTNRPGPRLGEVAKLFAKEIHGP